MVDQSKLELVRRLKSLVIIQKDFLDVDNLEDYDRVENEIRRLEERIAARA